MTGFFAWGAVGFHKVRRGGALPRPRATARVAPTEDAKCAGAEVPRRGGVLPDARQPHSCSAVVVGVRYCQGRPGDFVYSGIFELIIIVAINFFGAKQN